jgi:hypothetical protein
MDTPGCENTKQRNERSCGKIPNSYWTKWTRDMQLSKRKQQMRSPASMNEYAKKPLEEVMRKQLDAAPGIDPTTCTIR